MRPVTLFNRGAAVFSASAATTGGHRGLRHVPGAALWGRIAAAFYAAPDDPAARLRATHGGELRVSPGFPTTPLGEPAFPMPQCLRQPKHDQARKVKTALTADVWNLAHPKGACEATPGEAIKRAFLTPSGLIVRPKTLERGKTAVTPDARRAADAQYFQYEYLEAGQSWLAWIDGAEPAWIDRAVEALAAPGARLGRSSLKEFGGDFEIRPGGADDPRAFEPDPEHPDTLTLWCLSDLAFIDDYGAPDLAPSPSTLFGRKVDGCLDLGRSAISIRRYSPYNAWLDAHDREHAVIEAGSVLVYKLRGDPPPLEIFKAGVGLWRERGLGMTWPNPPVLRGLHPWADRSPRVDDRPVASEQGAATIQTAAAPLSDADQAILGLLRRRGKRTTLGADVEERAAGLVTRFTNIVAASRARGVASPSPTQWSLLAEQAAMNTGLDRLREALLHENTGTCSRKANPEWAPFGDVLKEILSPDGANVATAAAALDRAARRMRARMVGGKDVPADMRQ